MPFKLHELSLTARVMKPRDGMVTVRGAIGGCSHLRSAVMWRVAWERYLRHGKDVIWGHIVSGVPLNQGLFFIRGGQLQGDHAWAGVPCPVVSMAWLFQRAQPYGARRGSRPSPLSQAWSSPHTLMKPQ